MDWLSLFPGASRGKPRFMALAGAVLRQAEDLLPVIAALETAFSFASAEGVQLDALAQSAGLERNEAGTEVPDEDFRQYLLAKLALWAWDGTNKTVPGVLHTVLPGGTQTDNGDGTVTVTGTGGVLPIPAGIGIIQNSELRIQNE